MATREQVEALKRDWKRDPCYEIEETPGFEEHREELRAYNEEFVRQNLKRRDEMLREKALRMGCPGNVELAAYVEGLELALDSLGERLDNLEGV